MKKYFKYCLAILALAVAASGCKKNIDETVIQPGEAAQLQLSSTNLVLTEAQKADIVQSITWSAPEFGYRAAITYTVQIAMGGGNFAGAREVNTGNVKELTYTGAAFNELAIGLGIPVEGTDDLDIRVKSSLSDSVFYYSDTKTISVTTYKEDLPALLVQGGNSWVTPATRTNGFLLTSVNYDGKYEGYLNLPNADGYGGDAFTLLNPADGKVYGWGSSSTTMSVGGGNLWLTPAPNYMKVNADINALTITYTPVTFFISGDHNGWSTSATPMVYNTTTRVWEANNVNFTAGNKFVFTSNGGYDISYKVDGDGKVVYAGPPGWAGNNINAPLTGSFKVTLDLSNGNGNYTYKIE